MEQVDRPAVKPSKTPQPIVEKKTTSSWFKRKKDDKSKAMRVDSPSKEVNCGDANNVNATTTTNVVAVNGTDVEADLASSKQNIQEKIKSLGLDFFSQDFEGVTASSTRCLVCETTTEQRETMIDLSVPITENMETLELTDSFIEVSHKKLSDLLTP